MLRKKKDTLIQCLEKGKILEFNVKKKGKILEFNVWKSKDT